MGGRRRAYADDGAFVPGRAQARGGVHGDGPLVLGRCFEGFGRERVGLAGMGQDARECDAGRLQRRRHLEELGIGDQQPAAMAVAVNLDEGCGRHPRRPAGLAQDRGLLHRVEQHLDVDASLAKAHRPLGRVPRDADGIGHVAIAVSGEVFGLRQGGDRDRAGSVRKGAPGHVNRLGGLHVRAQRDAAFRHARAEAREVAVQPACVQDQSGRSQRGQGRGVGSRHPDAPS